jgi:hypothetical protein
MTFHTRKKRFGASVRRTKIITADRKIRAEVNIRAAAFITYFGLCLLGLSALPVNADSDRKKGGSESRGPVEMALPPPKVIWEDENQKAQCERYLEDIRVTFYKTRYYCIQDDACECAHHADRFLDLVKKCEDCCPEDYLSKNKYSRRLLKNVVWLRENRSCPIDISAEYQAVKEESGKNGFNNRSAP